MKRRWRLSRGQRTLRNLLLGILLMTLIWGLAGYPLPTMELEFRRMERTHLLPQSEIIFSAGAGETLMLGEREVSVRAPVVIGMTDDRATVCTRYRGIVGGYSVSLREGAAVCLMPGYALEAFTGVWESGATVLVLGVPEEVAGGEVELEAEHGGPMTGPGCRLGRGAWLFFAKAKGNGYGLQGNAPYTLTLYRADGSLLLEKRGRLENG